MFSGATLSCFLKSVNGGGFTRSCGQYRSSCGASGDCLAVAFEVVAEFFGVFGVGETALAAGFCFDFFGRKNEAIGFSVSGRVVGLVLHFCEVAEGYCFVEGGLAGGYALRLE